MRLSSGCFAWTVAAASALAPISAHAWKGHVCEVEYYATIDALRAATDEAAPAPEVPECSADSQFAPALPTAVDGPTPPWSRPLTAMDARRALHEARVLDAAGRHDEALLQLRIVSWALPHLADRIALQRAEILLKTGEPREACNDFHVAEESVDRDLVARAQVGSVRCLLAAHDRRAERALSDLMRRYDDLPDEAALRLALGEARESWGELASAANVYRELDLNRPGSTQAALARRRLAALAARGVEVRPFTPEERFDRAERLFRLGPLQGAREAIAALRRDASLSRSLRNQVAVLGARLARVEGRFDDADALLREAGRLPTEDADAAADRDPRAAALARAAHVAAAQARIRAISRGRPLRRLSPVQLSDVVELAASAGLGPVAQEALEALATRRTASPALRLDAAIAAIGVAPDAAIAAALGSLRNTSVTARYHYARTLERLGRASEAQTEYQRVIRDDRSETRWYAMWSRLRLGNPDARRTECEPVDANHDGVPDSGRVLPSWCDTTQLAADGPGGAHPPAPELSRGHSLLATREGLVDESPGRGSSAPAAVAPAARAPTVTAGRATSRDGPPDLDRIAGMLAPIASSYSEAYPWLARALDLVRIGEVEAASDELYQVYLAYRIAHRRSGLRAGLEAIYRGGMPGVRRPDAQTRRARQALTAGDRQVLAQVSAALGDPGTAVLFGGFRSVGGRPRAYAPLVERAARQHGIDPNLLLAVMRVESSYNKRIISPVGALGLMQIMPRTGRLISLSMGRADFVESELLDPETNIQFAAWYLSSLIRRFGGRLPLAVASYNGGPHNVRRWMREQSAGMPLDAFLERIPYDETRRYVRRVLGHYAAYRAQQGLPMTPLEVALPQLGTDTVGF